MEYKRIDNVIIARIDHGEEIVETLRLIAERENVTLANINALGAVDDFTVGVYNVDRQQYFRNDFQGAYEIVSPTGSVNTMDGEYYAHLHMSAGDDKGAVFGGHLNSARISVTCEMVIDVIDGVVDRKPDPSIGINLFEFV